MLLHPTGALRLRKVILFNLKQRNIDAYIELMFHQIYFIHNDFSQKKIQNIGYLQIFIFTLKYEMIFFNDLKPRAI